MASAEGKNATLGYRSYIVVASDACKEKSESRSMTTENGYQTFKFLVEECKYSFTICCAS